MVAKHEFAYGSLGVKIDGVAFAIQSTLGFAILRRQCRAGFNVSCARSELMRTITYPLLTLEITRLKLGAWI